MNIGYFLVEEEERERRAAATALATPLDLRGQLALVERQIAEIKAELDQHVNDDPSLWPLRRELVALDRKRRELMEQTERS